jgi:hypothetical protein
MKPMLTSRGTKRFKLENEKLLSTFAFKFNLCRYQEGVDSEVGEDEGEEVDWAVDCLVNSVADEMMHNEARGLLRRSTGLMLNLLLLLRASI